jgi:AraC family transcriptional regulator, transcriptional activator of pobA
MSNPPISALVDHLPVGIALLDRKGAIICAGGAIESMLGFSQHDLVGRSAIRLLMVSPPEAVHWYSKITSRQGLKLTMTLLLQTLNGPALLFDCVLSNLLHIEAFGGILVTLSQTRSTISRQDKPSRANHRTSTEDTQIMTEYRNAFRRLAGSGVIDMDKHLRRHFNFQIHRLEEMIPKLQGKIPLNRQSQFFLNLIIRGDGEKTIGPTAFPIRQNTLIAIPRRMVHASEYWASDSSGYFLGFNLDFLLSGYFPAHLLSGKRLFRQASRHHLQLTIPQARHLSGMYETLIEEYDNKHPHRNEYLVLKVHELVIASDRFFAQAGDDYTPPDHSEIIDRFEALIRQHHRTERSVTFYARALHMHPNHLNALVKRSTGLTAKATISGVVLEEARQLLCTTSMRIKEIADYLGFNDPDHLSKLFRKHFHLSPRQFKRASLCI